MKLWLAQLRLRFAQENDEELLALFDLYAEEALFGWKFILEEISKLPKGSNILEVGAGSFLLSCQLCRVGYLVTSLDPVGKGFAHFERIRDIVLEYSSANNCIPNILTISAENLNITEHFEFAFSINVMEHVDDVSLAVYNVAESLKGGGRYKFCCPNYHFPYEPHFDIPIFFSKKVTQIFFKKKIFSNQNIPDPIGTWESLNWINVQTIKSIIQAKENLRCFFNRCFLMSMLERVVTDSEFASRRSKYIKLIMNIVVVLKMHRLTNYIPVNWHPTIDCTILRKY